MTFVFLLGMAVSAQATVYVSTPGLAADVSTIEDSIAFVVYTNEAFDSSFYADSFTPTHDTGFDSWVVSADTLVLLSIEYVENDTGLFKGVRRRNGGSPIDAFLYDGRYHFLSVLQAVEAGQIYAIFRRK
ncbi:hypothetical protein N9104_01745 [Pseudomonadales bacterium]|nr:hypothetical protein [Pseudomonadales bacterium]